MKRTIIMLAIAAASLFGTQAMAACPIDITACGFKSAGDAGQFINENPDWTLLHPHTIGQCADGTFFVDLVLPAKRSGSFCYVVWYPPVGTESCPVGQTGNPSVSSLTQSDGSVLSTRTIK